MSRESVVEKLGERHEGVDYFYTTCHNNGCWDATCLIKCSVKDDKIVAIGIRGPYPREVGYEPPCGKPGHVL